MPAKVPLPSKAELRTTLGAAFTLWSGIVNAVGEGFGPLDLEWRPSKAAFGRICLLRHNKRTLLYLTPDKETIWVAIVLGERAYGIAMASSLPCRIKTMFSEAKPYAEGRGIRFAVCSPGEIPMITALVEIKTASR
ncbi:MAG: DUF3788 family protein [Limisphaerales bacterium]